VSPGLPSPEEMAAVAGKAGLDAIGYASAEPFTATRRHLEERRRAGLSAGMQFTFRNPARSTDPARALPGARSLVVGARSYRRRPAAAAGSRPAGRVARYSWTDHYRPLRDGLEELAGLLRDRGWQARVLADDNALVDRAAAHRAGIGWFGKNTLLLLPGGGSWYVLGSIVTDAPFLSSGGPVPDGCGPCTRCLTACPTGALSPGVLDARRCLAWLLEAPGPFPVEMRTALGGRVYGCDDCQEVCPVNRRADRADPPPGPGPGEEPTVDLLWMLEAGDDELLARLGRWYVPRRHPRYLRRNALVALGNVGDGADPHTGRVLAGKLADPDPMIREHATWAAARLGRSDLVRPAGAGAAGA
jgi:epoxyqueuosine reductase